MRVVDWNTVTKKIPTNPWKEHTWTKCSMAVYSGIFETSANKDAALADRLRRRKAKGSGKLKDGDKPPQIPKDVENEIDN